MEIHAGADPAIQAIRLLEDLRPMGPEELCILALDKLEHERLDAIARDARATIEAELAQQAAAKKQEEEEANARLARHQARVATEQLPQQQHSARTRPDGR